MISALGSVGPRRGAWRRMGRGQLDWSKIVPRVVLVLVVSTATTGVPAESTRRHPMRKGSAEPCLTVPAVPVGFTMSSRSASNEGVIEQTTTWLEDGIERTRTVQQMTEPGAYLDVDTSIENEVIKRDGVALLAMKQLFVVSTTHFGADLVTTSTTTFSPSLVLRPVSLCRNRRWTIDATTSMTTTSSNGNLETTSNLLPGSEGRVVEWRVPLAVPAGTFDTIRWEGMAVVNGGLFRTENWVSTLFGVPVRQVVYGPDGALIQVTEATKIGTQGAEDLGAARFPHP